MNYIAEENTLQFVSRMCYRELFNS